MHALARLIVVLGLLVPVPALANRLALVIGINDYEMIPPLSKAVGDAEAMSARLADLGFDVTTVLNPNRRELNQAITTFRRSLRAGDAAFVHFSGHGVEVDGRNLLLPRDIPLPTSGEEDFLAEEAIDLSALIDRVGDSGAAVRIFVVDACRDNPFGSTDTRGVPLVGGLALVEPPRGSFVLYSAGYRQTALDRLGPDDESSTSVYTRVLLDKIGKPGMSISEIARSVRVDVAALATSVGHEQSPAYYDELTEDFILVPPLAAGQVEAKPVNVADSREAEAFDRARSMATVGAWNAFLKNYPEGVFADLARAALADLTPAPAVEAEDEPVAATEPATTNDPILDEFAARQQLATLWDKGSDAADAGNDATYYESMSQALTLATERFGTDSEEYAQAQNAMIGASTTVGRMDDAIASARESIRVYSALFGQDDMRVLIDKANLASRLGSKGKAGEAEEIYVAVIGKMESMRLSASDKGFYAHALEGYAMVKSSMGDLDAAVELGAQSVAALKESTMVGTINYGWILANYAHILLDAGRCAEAMDAFTEAAEGMKRARVAESQRDYAEILRRLDRGCAA
jgi:tetratricopeptide (TPR) repeat protein